MKPISLYIHIPFCRKKCLYCDFLSAPAETDLQERYFHALLAEIIRTAKKCGDKEVITVFIGGGTPSLPDAKWIMQVMGVLKNNFKFAEHPEISMEMNPGTETLEKLTQYRKAGINRLSIGCQSLQDE
nr:radical SAM protein [Butyrivibrio sp.]